MFSAIPPLARAWAIRDTLCFDSASHAFQHCDIEISGSSVRAIVPPGASSLVEGVDGSSFICTPGIVAIATERAALADESECITTAGVQCASLSDILVDEAAPFRRTVALLTFGQRYLQLANSLFAARGALHVMPVLECDGRTSAVEVVEFAKFARGAGARIGVRLSSDVEKAREFRSRFHCSESALLSHLLPDGKDVTVFSHTRIDQHDAVLLDRMACAVSIAAPHDELSAFWSTHAGLFERSGVALYLHSESFRSFLDSLVAQATPLQHDAYVDALTRTGALALGLTDVGTIATGMKADICVFERGVAERDGAGSAAFLSLLATRQPAFTLVGGKNARVEAGRRESAARALYV